MSVSDSQPLMVCDCCGGDMPCREVWDARRDEAAECTGSIDARGRCRAWSDDDLWTAVVDGNGEEVAK